MNISPQTIAPRTDSDGSWVSVIALALAAFIFNTTEFVPVALLTDIAKTFDMQAAHVGIMITIYAWVVALASLPMMLVTRHMERKRLLLSLFVLFVFSHLVSSIASNFIILLISRVGIAFAHAIFWSITASLAIRVAPVGKEIQALGMLSTGTVLALVLGIPFGRIVGELFGWRITFGLVGGIAVATAIVLWKTLPELPSQNTGSIESLPVLFKRPALVLLFVTTIVIVVAQFTAYSYIEPFTTEIAHFTSDQTTTLLLVYGGSGILGSILFSRLSRKLPRAFPIIAILGITVSMFILLPLAFSVWGIMAMAVFWGIAIMIFGLVMQSKVLQLASDATDVAMSVYSGLYNVGIGGGALLGSIVGLNMGIEYVGIVGGVLGVFGLILAILMVRRRDFMVTLH
ncbi:sugar transporter [Acinetobacter rathckeae]|uniref:sugar transporter n=1 Tax=Acinetobacter rathckeae TaxID=2605272 RepID=UPI0018A321E2|nr:sugar transporter [Acinetobacter rathckeae]MBF7695652.1 sugar transporter [Acinetobacter rathckeae]